ncbi:hypothetical protein FNV43_RR25644 [Rhamnella rubrinervis]|uniref:Uncharacterized protein n=1 Tax=Rhamnella rubrinervis TaxID=2594499 RepID=A0A8K0GLQ8_9ROSA|nr:hypothetical protein FNV43_RR25644 [Rhamnella rubrinervis]
MDTSLLTVVLGQQSMMLKNIDNLGYELANEWMRWEVFCIASHGVRSLQVHGKTSLLFQFAFNTSLEDTQYGNGKVVFICNRRRLETNPPFLSQGTDPSSDTFHRIEMKYVDDDEDIKKYFSAFHLHDTFPAAVVIDDFGNFFQERGCQQRYGNPRGRDLAMVRTLALCHSAIFHANETRPCQLLLSETHHGDTPRLLFIYKRWIPTIFTVIGDGSGSFYLKSNSNLGSDSLGRTIIAKYSIALHYLVLEGITEDHERSSGFMKSVSSVVGFDLVVTGYSVPITK